MPNADMEGIEARVLGPVSGEDSRVALVLRRRYPTPPSPLPYNLSTHTLYKKIKHYGSWGFIRSQVKILFDRTRGGFFIEAGALDGERLSNTLWLEQELGWSGLLIEPSPYNYNELVNKRRKAWISNTCLSPNPYPEEQVMVSLSRKLRKEMEVERLLHDFRGSSHLLGVTMNTHIYDPIFQNSDKTYSVLQCFPLVSYLLALNVTTVDFLSLDIQGAERAVLMSIPWQKVNIRVIVVEIVFHESFDKEFVEYMSTKGYKLIYFRGEDYVFVRESDPVMGRVRVIALYIDGPLDQSTNSSRETK